MRTFRSTLQLGGKTATGFEVPAKVVESLRSGKRPPVRVTINGYTYRSTVAPIGGKFWLPVSAENRDGAGVKAGDKLEADIELDTAPREVVEPPDFTKALDRDKQARRFYDGLSYSNKRQHVLSIEGAKTAETRERRIAKAVSALKAGKK
jgi:hypothetical protein